MTVIVTLPVRVFSGRELILRQVSVCFGFFTAVWMLRWTAVLSKGCRYAIGKQFSNMDGNTVDKMGEITHSLGQTSNQRAPSQRLLRVQLRHAESAQQLQIRLTRTNSAVHTVKTTGDGRSQTLHGGHGGVSAPWCHRVIVVVFVSGAELRPSWSHRDRRGRKPKKAARADKRERGRGKQRKRKRQRESL